MITKLTDEQVALFPTYVKKWIDIGMNTDRLDYDATSDIVGDFRELIEMERDVPLLLCKNPIEAWVICELVTNNNVDIKDVFVEMATVFDGNPKKYVIGQASLPYQAGSFFGSVFSFYDYFYHETEVEIKPELLEKYKAWENTSKIGCIYPLENMTVVCEKPTEINMSEAGLLHKDGSAALVYDGLGDFKIFYLNGILVPEYLATTDSQKLSIDDYNQETNADVKAEFIRKVGIERFLDRGKKVDSFENYPDTEEYEWWHKSQYELWDMSFMFPTLDYAPYIKMLNLTTKIWHVEGVSPESRKLDQALKERFSGRDMKIVNIA